ncbi:radical SAM protein [Anaerotalea alkaliphila]|uniref:Radical SAM protein n=1 Tax=Anaerotalea alkaliphila TaxID=2662126 RepID=A0A7X5HV33_9FIRM|nr:radical SAM protein [Anaerotalea alkaliphila]NDL67177.1 radical SAM protein [Anaerotalea alkaliphila]
MWISKKLCASHDIISKEKAVRLKEAGVGRYHHNVETSREHFRRICDTHTYQDRLDTIRNVLDAGMDVCCGGIIGMGESAVDRIRMAFEIREVGVASVPVNVLNPVAGRPLGESPRLTPEEILLAMAMFRLVLPKAAIRFAGGRSALGEHQRKGLEAGVDAMLEELGREV